MTPPSSPPDIAQPGVEEEARGTAGATPTVKAEPGADGGAALINIKVQSQTAEDVFFRVKPNVKLRRLMDMYCGRHSLDPKAVLFLDDEGRHIRPAQTPEDVGLKDGDVIDVMLEQNEQEKGKGTTPVKAGQGVKVKSGTNTAPPVNVKAEAGGGGDASLINIKFHSQTAADEFFRVKRDVKLQRLIDMYCSKLSLNSMALEFLDPYGHRVQADKTPQEAGLEDGDEISVHPHQVGGGGLPVHASRASA